ncbi:MAG: hypothetical protein ACRD4H_10340, partial [Candidatus Acidiferrales bacterium]
MPWAFEPNVGQTDAKAKFLARANDATVFLTRRGIVLSWKPPNAEVTQPKQRSQDALRLDFLDSNRDVRISGRSMLGGKTNYLLGCNSRKWLRNVPQYSSVEYDGLYSGIDAQFYGGNGGLEYDLVASPGGSWRDIRLRAFGADAMHLDRDGNLIFRVDQFSVHGRQVVMRRPKIYQTVKGQKVRIAGGYRLFDDNTIGFAIGKHRPALPIVIDPSISISYTTFLGGNGEERGSSVAVDSAGAVYV